MLLYRFLKPKPPLEKTETKTLGDVRIEVVERGNRVSMIKVHHAGRVPDFLQRFTPEVREKAQRWWWSTSRERRILRAAKSQGRLTYDIVREALLHDRAANIERRMEQQRARIDVKRHKRLFATPAQTRLLEARGGTALARPDTSRQPQSLVETLASSREVPLAEPRGVQDRGRGR